MVFCFIQNFFFRTTQELEYLFFLEIIIRLYDKNSESDYFFFPPPKSFKLNDRSLIVTSPKVDNGTISL
jgi:hypothetical protein